MEASDFKKTRLHTKDRVVFVEKQKLCELVSRLADLVKVTKSRANRSQIGKVCLLTVDSLHQIKHLVVALDYAYQNYEQLIACSSNPFELRLISVPFNYGAEPEAD